MRRVKEDSQSSFIVKISKHRLFALTCCIKPIYLYQGALATYSLYLHR